MKRKYVDVVERRLPWSLFPIPEQLSLEQRARVLAAYKQQMNIIRYRKAKTSLTFVEWDCVFTIPLMKSKVVYNDSSSTRQSRSGRLLKSVPQYVDDGSDSDASTCKRKGKKKHKKSNIDDDSAQSILFKDSKLTFEDLGKIGNQSASVIEKINLNYDMEQDIESLIKKKEPITVSEGVLSSNQNFAKTVLENNILNNDKILKYSKGDNFLNESSNARCRPKRMKMNIET